MRPRQPAATMPKRHGVARVISKMGIASRTQACAWVDAGRVRVNGKLVRDPDFPVLQGIDRVEIADLVDSPVERMAIALNKPRGIVTSAADEQGRKTVYSCLEGAGLPWLAPVGRLDKASEGLLLLCNDPEWAAAITDPASGPDKTYHVQVDCLPDAALIAGLQRGVLADGMLLRAKSARALRSGTRHGWIEVVLDQGRNRQIRRMLRALDVAVLRLVRVAIGNLELGDLGKGKWRRLQPAEIAALVSPVR